jgi:hypothetical protein
MSQVSVGKLQTEAVGHHLGLSTDDGLLQPKAL